MFSIFHLGAGYQFNFWAKLLTITVAKSGKIAVMVCNLTDIGFVPPEGGTNQNSDQICL